MLPLPAGDLQRLELVGSGGFGYVYKGWSQMLAMDVALKIIQGAHSTNLKKLMKDLIKERDVMQKASNPYVLRLLGVYEKPEGNLTECGLVMEYMPYGSLRSLFDNIPDVPWALRYQILHQVVLGMNYLHSLHPPIIHRDLKPGNVLLNKYLDVQITDFGLSKISGATTSAMPSFAGTWSYMPPEALNDINYEITKSYDVYSFGILMWTVFSAEEPYPAGCAAIIRQLVCEGQRPKVSIVDQYTQVKMVSEAKELMIRCWDHNANSRPSFHDCSEKTKVMTECYREEVNQAVRSVQDLLIKKSLEDQGPESSGFSSFNTDEFLKIFGETPGSQQSQPSSLGGEEEDKSLALIEKNVREEHPSDSGTGTDRLLDVIKSSGEYKKITKKLSSEGLINEFDWQGLKKAESLVELARATEKSLRDEFKKEPKKVLKVLKSFF